MAITKKNSPKGQAGGVPDGGTLGLIPGYEGQAHVEVTHPDKSVEGADEKMGSSKHPADSEETARVGLKMGTTINTGNFNSVRIDVSVSLPCTADEVDETYEYAMEWVDARLGQLTQSVKEAYGS